MSINKKQQFPLARSFFWQNKANCVPQARNSTTLLTLTFMPFHEILDIHKDLPNHKSKNYRNFSQKPHE